MDWIVGHGVMFVLVLSVGTALLGVWCWWGIREDVRIARGPNASQWSVLKRPGRRVVGMVIAVVGLMVLMHVASEIPGQRRLYNRLLHYGVETQATVVNNHHKGWIPLRTYRLTIHYSVNGQAIQAQIPVDPGYKAASSLHQGSVVKVTYDRREPNVSRLSEDAKDGGLLPSFAFCLISVAAIFGGGHIARRTARTAPGTRQASEKQVLAD